MRRTIYSTKNIKHPEFFANMCNITGSEEVFPVEFEQYMQDKYKIDVNDLDDEEFDYYFEKYRASVDDEFNDNEVEVSKEDSTEYSLDIDLATSIDMNSDGSWEFNDDSWATCAETEDGGWYASDDTLITTADQLVQDVSSLLQLYLPIGKGTFDITGDIHLVYDTDEGESMFDIAHSTAKNFTSKKE